MDGWGRWKGTTKDPRYGGDWPKTRRRILERDGYLCRCKYCRAEERVTAATEVDHVIPVSRARILGWSRERIEADSNLQAIGKECHKRKTLEDEGKTYAGPPRKIGLDGFPITGSRSSREN